MQNFTEIARTFVENDAANADRERRRELEHALLGLLNNPVRRARASGAAARHCVEANRGARGKTMTAMAQGVRRRIPATSAPSGWSTESQRYRGGGPLPPPALPGATESAASPVASCHQHRQPGVGGRAKTPLTALVAARLRDLESAPS